MRSEIYTCDVCSARRGESNHWYLAIPVRREYMVILFALSEWNEAGARLTGTRHICGLECAIRFMARCLDKGLEGEHGDGGNTDN